MTSYSHYGDNLLMRLYQSCNCCVILITSYYKFKKFCFYCMYQGIILPYLPNMEGTPRHRVLSTAA